MSHEPTGADFFLKRLFHSAIRTPWPVTRNIFQTARENRFRKVRGNLSRLADGDQRHFLYLRAGQTAGANRPPETKTDAAPVVVQLVTDFATKTPVSELENFEVITETQFTTTGSKEVTLGERCTLWVRNAHVDGKHFFERYYQEKFVGRRATLEIAAKDLVAGDHFIEPGHHRFAVEADGRITSTDPDIQIDGHTVSLRMYRVNVLPVDARRTGPPEFRLVPVPLSILSMSDDFRIDPKALPDLKSTYDPQKPPAGGKAPPPVTEMLSHNKTFLSLSVWLPANEVGQGYLLYPSWQTFQLHAGGKIDVANEMPRTAFRVSISAASLPMPDANDANTNAGPTIVIPYQPTSGRISSHTSMNAGVGAAPLVKKMNLGPTLEPLKFTAGHEKPDPAFFLSIDNDATKRPNKFFVADNTSGDKEAIRLLTVEWDSSVFARGSEGRLAVRLLETPGKQTLKQPEVRLSYSPYKPSSPAARDWKSVQVIDWKNDATDGTLRFQAPDIDFQFVMLRVQIFDHEDSNLMTPLFAEVAACVIEKDQRRFGQLYYKSRPKRVR